MTARKLLSILGAALFLSLPAHGVVIKGGAGKQCAEALYVWNAGDANAQNAPASMSLWTAMDNGNHDEVFDTTGEFAMHSDGRIQWNPSDSRELSTVVVTINATAYCTNGGVNCDSASDSLNFRLGVDATCASPSWLAGTGNTIFRSAAAMEATDGDTYAYFEVAATVATSTGYADGTCIPFGFLGTGTTESYTFDKITVHAREVSTSCRR